MDDYNVPDELAVRIGKAIHELADDINQKTGAQAVRITITDIINFRSSQGSMNIHLDVGSFTTPKPLEGKAELITDEVLNDLVAQMRKKQMEN